MLTHTSHTYISLSHIRDIRIYNFTDLKQKKTNKVCRNKIAKETNLRDTLFLPLILCVCVCTFRIDISFHPLLLFFYCIMSRMKLILYGSIEPFNKGNSHMTSNSHREWWLILMICFIFCAHSRLFHSSY